MKSNKRMTTEPDEAASLSFNMMTIACLLMVVLGCWILVISERRHALLTCAAGWYFLLAGSAAQAAIHHIRFGACSPHIKTTDRSP
jgi:thiol:disulfide interchange protein